MDTDLRVQRLEEKIAHMERLQQVLDDVVRGQELRLQHMARQLEELRGASPAEHGGDNRG